MFDNCSQLFLQLDSEFNIWFNEISPTLLIGDKKNRYVQLDMSSGIVLATYEQIRIAVEENST